MKPTSRRRVVAILFTLAAGSATGSRALASNPPFEEPGTFPASRFLPPAELSGAEWKVAPRATSDGVFNLYTLENRFGPLDARGRSALARRVKEVEAMAELERVSKTKVFTDAVVESAVAPVKVVASFADNPKETVKGISGGVKRLWSKTKFQVKEISHDARETVAEQRKSDEEGGPSASENTQKAKAATTAYAKKYLGLSRAERRWYAALGVDPYTDNVGLRKAVTEVSRVEAAGRFGMRFAGLPSIPGASEISKVMDLVWKTDPWELRARNRKILLDAGLSEDDARAFEDNPAMSPTLQSGLIQSLVDLEGVKGRVHVIERAVEVEDASSGRMLVASTALLVRYHRQVGPLTEILRGSRLPAALAKSGALVATVLADALFWTPEVADGVDGFVSTYAEVRAARRELRVAGIASDRFQAEARSRGWTVIDRWQVDAPEDHEAATKPAP